MKKSTSNLFKDVDFFHGSPYEIERFSLEFCGEGNDHLGSGFYLITDPVVARGYCELPELKARAFSHVKPKPTLHRVRINLSNPLDTNHIQPLSSIQVRKIILASPVLDDALANYGDVDFEGRDKIINQAIVNYIGHDDTPLIKTLHCLSNDFYQGEVKAFNECIEKLLGYDGVIDRYDDHTIVCLWHEDSADIVARINPNKHRQIDDELSF